ncbi:MAG: PQQ-binding-like beta-propeller repeat protein [Synergistaceae bacterium]|jgi:outer membrane protein assembly factor BamB|nr:PQQ-binding-like beta-propeller repeat protein [Synergistaceae bacterium]
MKRVLLVSLPALALCLAVSALAEIEQALAFEGVLGWMYKASAPIGSGIAVYGGPPPLVLAGDNTGALHAVYAASGQGAWISKGGFSVAGTPTVSDGLVVFAQGDGTITALAAADGSPLWRHSPGDDAADTVVDGTAIGGGMVFFARGDGRMVALDLKTGAPRWEYVSEGQLRSAPAFANGLVLLGEQNGKFSAIDPASGRRIWGGGAGGPINTPASDGENVYFSSWDGSVHKVRIKGVVPQWNVNVGDSVTTPPFVANGRVLVGTARGRVEAISAGNGARLWTFDTGGGSVSGAPLEADGLVFVGGGQGTFFVLDAATGAARFTFPTGGGINGSAAFAGGVVFLGSADGSIYAIR